MLRVDFVSLFPEVLWPFLNHSILGRAREKGLVGFACANPRDFAYDRHGKMDDTPFGGEPGMLLRAEPVALAIESLRASEGQSTVIVTDPAAKRFEQSDANRLAGFDQLLFVCGHYEGIDDRVREEFNALSFSIGDFVLTNG